MKRHEIITLISGAINVPDDHQGPTMSAVREAVNNPTNENMQAIAAELDEELARMRDALRAVNRFDHMPVEEDESKPGLDELARKHTDMPGYKDDNAGK